MDEEFDIALDLAPHAAEQGKTSSVSLRARRRRQNFLYAAMRSIRRVGTREATMDVIATEAGVTRATIYREFHSRQGLLSAVAAYRFESFCNRFFRRIEPNLSLPEVLETYFLASAILATRNPVTRGLVRGSLGFTRPQTSLHQVAQRAWEPLLQRARFAGGLETLDHEDIVQWILVAQFTLCRLALDTQMPIPRLRRYIRNFIAPAFAIE